MSPQETGTNQEISRVLRDAAGVLRGRCGELASHIAWPLSVNASPEEVAERVDRTYGRLSPSLLCDPWGAYIALFPPVVAEELAAWMEGLAVEVAEEGYDFEAPGGDACFEPALRIAREVNRVTAR